MTTLPGIPRPLSLSLSLSKSWYLPRKVKSEQDDSGEMVQKSVLITGTGQNTKK